MSETASYEPEPSDVRALLADLDDPRLQALDQYLLASKDEALYRAAADLAATYRAQAVAALHGDGLSYGRIADLVGLSRGRVQQLVERMR